MICKGCSEGRSISLTDAAPTTDQSANTSAVTINLAGATVALNGKGSNQDDTFNVQSFSASKGATVDGGAGNDTVSFASYGTAVNINQEVNYNSGGAAGLTLTSIEKIVGTSLGDSITGSSGNDTIQGGIGSDNLLGRGGNDTFVFTNLAAELTGDTIDGGAGTDVLLTADTLVDISGNSNISNVETLQGTTAGATFTVAAAQVGTGKITTVAGATGSNTLKVATTTDLSAVTLTNISTVELAATGNMVIGASNLAAGRTFKAAVAGTDDLYLKGAGETYDLTTVTLSGIQEVKDTSTTVKSDTVVVNQAMVKSTSSETGKVDTITLGNSTAAGGAGTDTLKAAGNLDLQNMAGSGAGVVANVLDFGTATQITLKEGTFTLGSIKGGTGTADTLVLVESTASSAGDYDISALTTTLSGVERLIYSDEASTSATTGLLAVNATQVAAVSSLLSSNAAVLKLAAGDYDLTGKQIAGFTTLADNGPVAVNLTIAGTSDLGTITTIANQTSGGVVTLKLNSAGTYDFSGITASTDTATELVVSGSTGADVITAFKAAVNADAQTIDAGRGNDTITAGTGDDVIIGGEGNDTINLGATGGQDTVSFSAPALNGTDTINNFLGGSTVSSGNADILKFASADFGSINAAFNGTWANNLLSSVANVSGQGVDDKLFGIKASAASAIDEASEVANIFATASNGAGNAFLATGAQAIVVTGADNSTTVNVWYVDNAATAGVAASEVKLIGTITLASGDIDDLHVNNFAF